MPSGIPVFLTNDNGTPITISSAAIGSSLLGSMTQFVLFQSSIPFIILSSGSIGNNGALSGLTALPTTYANAYVLVPAGAIAAGVPAAAAWYYATFSDASDGTIFNNVYSGGQPSIPASPTAFATTGPGAFTGVSAGSDAITYTMPANTMGFRDNLRVTYKASVTNTAATKTFGINLGGTQAWSRAATTISAEVDIVDITARDSTQIQLAGGTNAVNPGEGGAFIYLTKDMTASQVVSARMTNATPATNNMILENLTIELLRGS